MMGMQDPKRLPQEPCLKFLTDVKAAAVAAVAAARAVPRARLTGRTGKEATLPAKVQLQRGAGREGRPPRPPQQVRLPPPGHTASAHICHGAVRCAL